MVKLMAVMVVMAVRAVTIVGSVDDYHNKMIMLP